MARKTVGIQHWITILATVFVVGGVVMVVKLQPGGDMEEEVITAAPEFEGGRVVVFADADAVHIIDAATGVEIQECAMSGMTRIEKVTSDGIVIGVSSGDQVRLGFDCVAASEVFPALAAVMEGEDERAPSVTFSEGKPVALVATNGRPFREAQLVGWMDDTHVALVAFRGDVRYALAAGKDGALTVLAALPEVVEGFAAGGGAFWYVSATPGPGIEFGPRGPSAIHRVALDGKDVVVAEDAEEVVEAFSVGPQGEYAYVVGGTLFVGKDGAQLNAGTGMPVGWTDDGRVLVVDGQNELSLKSMDGAMMETQVTLPSETTAVWSVDVVH